MPCAPPFAVAEARMHVDLWMQPMRSRTLRLRTSRSPQNACDLDTALKLLLGRMNLKSRRKTMPLKCRARQHSKSNTHSIRKLGTVSHLSTVFSGHVDSASADIPFFDFRPAPTAVACSPSLHGVHRIGNEPRIFAQSIATASFGYTCSPHLRHTEEIIGAGINMPWLHFAMSPTSVLRPREQLCDGQATARPPAALPRSTRAVCYESRIFRCFQSRIARKL